MEEALPEPGSGEYSRVRWENRSPETESATQPESEPPSSESDRTTVFDVGEDAPDTIPAPPWLEDEEFRKG